MTSCGSRAMVTLRAGTTMLAGSTRTSTFPSLLLLKREKRNCSIKSSSLDPPDVGRLAETARISLTPQEVQDFGPKIHQVVEWFGQLQAVNLESVEPALRSDIDGDNLREDTPRTFENREAIIAAIPSYEEPYIKVPKVLNKE
ncbi:glutamyl-tRNA(Gln) amidotransferase subunit C, chloroplastic/mitochondrial [Beta vulgaris subsp. vulgaris]|uniref:glutamyl-tRNA(Gln) amidotransferase subunit C, chloroplastic/mitochondrial n=1 Tax=Beta vulgaris subsp. vulgaris TaxID=3555 RepID=UPI0020369D31|nr:glutamyl-tRNA(Gln) amidotransferase subunit C, chloroplastic/mitochondrial [Beta vulgaris subsp. vulgaris]XP_048495778.1 glutamyl-tRNA(Gln) amidotransferase subunit C, chloroplastic/mitochondrial [Beta vulgaris subsp. vulgaris]XP_048495779.1 glutamyl-tRNA(Gln) amidotransferase subunit C, chloroplastic/mitochondrial [Beta vulgaris subsp. vulgaris]